MAQRIVTFCDQHLGDGDGEEVDGRPVIVSLDGTPERMIDLCPDCEKALVGGLREALTAYGRRTDGMTPKKRGRPPTAPSAVEEMDPDRPKRKTRQSGPRFEQSLYQEFFLTEINGHQVWQCPGCEVVRPGTNNGLVNLMAHHRTSHDALLSTVLVDRLGPQRTAGLALGQGGMLVKPSQEGL